MTLLCPLNKPQCKRSIMTASGPFEKKECPLSKNRKCSFAPTVCPMFPQAEDECYWPKIKGVMEQGGCKVKPNPMSQLASQCCKVQNVQMQNAGQRSYPPPNCAELPPCVRCSFGHPKKDEGDLESTKKAKEKKESVKSKSPNKDEGAKQFTSPSPDRSPSLQSRKNRLSRCGKNESMKNKPGSRAPSFKMKECTAKIAAGKTKKVIGGKTEDVKVQKSRHRSKKTEETKQQATAPEVREKIFREAVYDKVGKLQNREHLVVPQCSSATRQIMPCAACLVDLLGTPAPGSGPFRTSGTGDEPDERCRLERIMNSCTAFRVPSVCPNGCPCTDVPLLDDEEVDDDCPFLQHPPSSSVPPRGCPLSRLPDHPFVIDAGRIPERGAAFDPCKCPIIPGNCCYTLPGCPVHTMRALIDCPNLNENH